MSNNKYKPLKKPIPSAVLAPIAASTWQMDDWSLNKFESLLESHADGDFRAGLTCRYSIEKVSDQNPFGGITAKEFADMVRAGVVDGAFYREDSNCYGLNQHWVHSLEQFYAEVQAAWVDHQTRTTALLGTPAGRIYRKGAV